MKHFLITLATLTIAIGANSAPVTQRQALGKAQQFFVSHGISMSSKAKAFRTPQSTGTTAPYYVFNAGDNNGYAIVSGDDRTAPILGYALSGSVSEKDMPDNMKAWLQSYAEQIEYIQKNNITVSAAATTTEDHPRIKKMLTTQWSQGGPYNNNCPFDGNNRSVTGCVATAMAQVLYYQYQQHPNTITKATTAAIPGYTTWTKKINVSGINAGSSIDWANMIGQYGGGASEAQNKAVANLMLYCGESVKMDYTSSSSGAQSYEVINALRNYFDFDPCMKFVYRDNGGYTNREWNDLVYNELANNRVVYYSGYSSAGSGHAFVINGYEGNHFFDVNWGWGGQSDGAFLLSVLLPSSPGTGAGNMEGGFNLGQDMLLYAEPNHNGMQAEAQNYRQNGSTLSYTLHNNGSTASINYGFGIVAADASISTIGTTMTANNLAQNGNTAIISIDLSTLADGTYAIAPVAKLTTDDKWQNIRMGHVAHVTIENGNVTFETDEYTNNTAITATDFFASSGVLTGTVKLTAKLKNNSNEMYEGKVYVKAYKRNANGTTTTFNDSQDVAVMNGSNTQLSMNWVPTASGSYRVNLCNDPQGNNVIGSDSATVRFVNPNFERTSSTWGNIPGWIQTGTVNLVSQNNSDFKKNGTYYIESWQPNGTMNIYQDVDSLTAGTYRISAVAKARGVKSAEFYVGDSVKEVTIADSVKTYTITFTVKEGEKVRIGFRAVGTGRQSSWVAIDNFYLRHFNTSPTLTPVTGDMNNDVREAMILAINKYNGDKNDDDYEAAMQAIDNANASIKAYANAKAALEGREEFMKTTNFYDSETRRKYYNYIVTRYNRGTLTDEVADSLQNPLTLVTWENTHNNSKQVNEFLGAPWGITDYSGDLYVNQWSMEGENDGSNFKVPFFEYRTENANTLSDKTFTGELNKGGVRANTVYDITATVRLRLADGNKAETPKGIYMQVGDGQPTEITGSLVNSTEGNDVFYICNAKATGSSDSERKLTLKFSVTNTNVNWLAFQHVNYTKSSQTGISSISNTNNGEEKAYNLAGQRVRSSFKGVTIVNGKKIIRK